jgi:hypothetical protein
MEYNNYWSQTTDGRLSTAQTTAKINCRLLSQSKQKDKKEWGKPEGAEELALVPHCPQENPHESTM